jgi:hypothetical protein
MTGDRMLVAVLLTLAVAVSANSWLGKSQRTESHFTERLSDACDKTYQGVCVISWPTKSQRTKSLFTARSAGVSSGACDERYQGACVPIASDVDCAGGRGNGPAYFRGPAAYEGSDPYGLDSDGDGILCEPSFE